MSIQFRPLGKVREMVQAIGFDVSYAYDDLVFSDHSLFIIQFDDKRTDVLKLFINADCVMQESKRVEKLLGAEAQLAGLIIEKKGTFSINQKEGTEELEVMFN